MQRLWEPLQSSAGFAEAVAALAEGAAPRALVGLSEEARALVVPLAARRARRAILLVVPDDTLLDRYQRNLVAFAGLTARSAERIVLMPGLDADPYGAIAPHPEVLRERVVALTRIARGEADVVVLPVRALLQWLPSVEEFGAASREIREGDELPPDHFVLQAMSLGYLRADTVSSPGEVSRRGGIIDVFPPTSIEPVRIELFGDSVESLRSFDTDNQRSTGRLHSVVVGPALENPPTETALSRLEQYLGGSKTTHRLRARLEALREQGYWPGMEGLARIMARRPVSLFEHTRNLALVVDDPEKTREELARAVSDLGAQYADSPDRILPPPTELFIDGKEIQRQLDAAALTLTDLRIEEAEEAEEADVTEWVCRPVRAWAGKVGDLAEHLAGDRRAVCAMRTRGSAERLTEVLREYGIEPSSAAGVFVGIGALRAGFELPEIGLEVLSEREVFGEPRRTADRRAGKRAAFVSDFRDLKRGDLVVHVDHGVARFAGLGRPKGGSLNRDFMLLEFAGGDRLFVPVDRLDLVQRYSGVAKPRAALDKLGGPGWERAKARVRKSVQLMAKELLELYARRAAARGHAFAEDSPWQQELESAFPFELTPDQDRAVREVKQEMESERVMDRLLVGDVGFGKTEVAVRGAFKAVMDGRQVAVLSPTTVLAAQHHATFTERFAPYPIRVELVSRFRSAADIRRVLGEVAGGSVDVLVGTHRMLSADVRFKRLGLLVVDEEQRFGVAHKERLKRLSIGVDVLSMTATPIPRTLQMSLAGVRDLSVIETPPPGRMAIQTYLVPFRKATLAQAIRQELRRNGQIFVVHNRIETLHAMARAVSEMVPDARIVVAHGKMADRALEAVMLKFVKHEADVLVTTTIIENGLDIPRANTMIVNRADRFGLAQLYQLRGRVGRSHHHAYAYFVIPGRQTLSDEARKRLKALQDFSELGAGFRLAAADLEIRGAGELLGSKQHGHIATMGFDMYCQMLERAVREQQGEIVSERQPPSLHLGVDIKIPESYLGDSGERLGLYKRLAQAETTDELDQLESETEDRFGHLPQTARNLFEMGRLRLIAERAGVKSVDLAEATLQVRFHERPSVDPQRIIDVIAEQRGTLTPSGMLRVPAPERARERIAGARGLLERLLGLADQPRPV